MRKYLIGLTALSVAIVLAIVISGQMRSTAAAEGEATPAADAPVAPSATAPAAETTTAGGTMGDTVTVTDPPVRPAPGAAPGTPTPTAPARTETARPKAPIGTVSPSGAVSPPATPQELAEGE